MESDSLLNSFVRPAGFPALPSGWEASSTVFPGAGGARLFSLHLSMKEVAPSQRKTLVLVHGQGEHCGRYLHFPYFLTTEKSSGVTDVCAFDLRGHGRSEGLRGHVERFDDYVDDLGEYLEFLRARLLEKHGAPPALHLFGHSMGGLIALRLLLLKPEIRFESASVSAPLLGLKLPVPVWKKGLGYGLSRIWGDLQLGSAMDETLICSDPAVQKAYKQDLLVHSKATPRFFTELQRAMADTLSRKEGYQAPLLFLVPKEDGIVDPQVVISYANEVKEERKELVTYDGFRHESFNEQGKERAFEDLKRWIRQNSTKKKENGSGS